MWPIFLIFPEYDDLLDGRIVGVIGIIALVVILNN